MLNTVQQKCLFMDILLVFCVNESKVSYKMTTSLFDSRAAVEYKWNAALLSQNITAPEPEGTNWCWKQILMVTIYLSTVADCLVEDNGIL